MATDLKSLAASITCGFNVAAQNTPNAGYCNWADNATLNFIPTFGNAAGQANQVYEFSGTGTTTIQLKGGSTVNPFGATFNPATICMVIVRVTTAASTVTLACTGSTTAPLWFGSLTSTETVSDTSPLVRYNTAGWTAHTTDFLVITGGAANYTVTLVGAQA